MVNAKKCLTYSTRDLKCASKSNPWYNGDAPVWKERSSKLVPNFTYFFPWGHESTPQAHINFDDVRTPSEFSVIKIPTRPTPVAAPRDRNV